MALLQRVVRSEDILQGAREVLIQHGAETYRLRLTKAGKLILNK
ncbi:MAG: hemin uptake protein HemP [Planctomycetaceae bacterium]|nr:hemin uptake protein HemP [Planctomycetaceae bacterium]